MHGILEVIVFSFAHYGLGFLLALISYVIGRKLTRVCIIFNSGWEKTVFSTGLGLGVIACIVLALGLLHLLYKEIIIFVLSLSTILCVLGWKEVKQDIYELFVTLWTCKLWLILSVLCALFFLPYFLLPLYPPTAFDATMYHLPFAKAYAQNHSLVFLPFIRFSFFPQINEMLFSLMLILSDDVAAHLVQFLMMCLVALGLYAWGQRLFNPRVGCWAAALWLSNPLVIWAGSSAYVETGLACFIFFGVYAFSNWLDTDETYWIVLSAAFLGFSAAAKYSALFFLALFGFIIVLKEIKKRSFRQIALFTLIVALIAGPWYLRNYYYTGNPVFPFFSEVFGYRLWNSTDLQGLLGTNHAYGAGKSLQSFLLLPWNLAFNQKKFLMEAPFSQIYFFALPFLLLSLLHSKIRELFIIVFLYTLFWFSTAQVLRYLFPVIPLLSLAVAASFEHCLGFLPSGKVKWMKKGIITFGISIALCRPGWLYATHKVQNEDLPPSTKYEQNLYLTQRLPSFPAYQYLNQTRGRNYSLYALFDENMAYFADGTFMGDWFGPARFKKIYSRFSNPKDLHQQLRALGANFFLIRRGRIKMELPGEDSFPPSHFNLVMKNDKFLLFEIVE